MCRNPNSECSSIVFCVFGVRLHLFQFQMCDLICCQFYCKSALCSLNKYVYIYIHIYKNLKKSCKIKPHKRQQRKRREKRMRITFQQQTKTGAYFQWKHLCQAAKIQVNTGMNEDMDEISLTRLAPGEVCCRFKWVAGSLFLNSGGEIWGDQVTRC